MYAQRMMIDPQYLYPGQRPLISRPPGDHGTQHIPHYNMQVCYVRSAVLVLIT